MKRTLAAVALPFTGSAWAAGHTIDVRVSNGMGTFSRTLRISDDGQQMTPRNKRGPDGNALPEGRSRSQEDIGLPDIQRAFKTEMTYWLRTWLKKKSQSNTAALTKSLQTHH